MVGVAPRHHRLRLPKHFATQSGVCNYRSLRFFCQKQESKHPHQASSVFFTSVRHFLRILLRFSFFFLLIHYLCWFFVASRIPNSGRKYTNYSIISTSTSPFLVNNCRSDRWGSITIPKRDKGDLTEVRKGGIKGSVKGGIALSHITNLLASLPPLSPTYL